MRRRSQEEALLKKRLNLWNRYVKRFPKSDLGLFRKNRPFRFNKCWCFRKHKNWKEQVMDDIEATQEYEIDCPCIDCVEGLKDDS